MAPSCSCLKLCSLFVSIANIILGLYILIYGIEAAKEYFSREEVTIGLIIVYFQISLCLIFVGFLLLIGAWKNLEKLISMYLLLSSLLWFVITMLAVSYMLFYNTQVNVIVAKNETVVTTTTSTTPAPLPKPTVPIEKAVGFSLGLVLFWCGQLGVYKFHEQVMQKNIINTGESYVNSAIRSN